MILQELRKKGLIHPPRYVVDSCCYLVQMGSAAYGVSTDTSDIDLYGFCVPPKDMVFPHLRGEIAGFGTQVQRFDQWQEHHVKRPDNQHEYDMSVYSIVRYFHLCMECNPNMIDSLFVPHRCVSYANTIGQLVREKRKMFLHKGAWFKFKGYAFAQLSKIQDKQLGQFVRLCEDYALDSHKVTLDAVRAEMSGASSYLEEVRMTGGEVVTITDLSKLEELLEAAHKRGGWGSRFEMNVKGGYDLKYAYQLVRLLNEIEQIMIEHDLDVERNREQLKAIRRGEWTLEEVENYFTAKERSLEDLYTKSTLQHKPDEAAIKELLMNCLEIHFGSIGDAVKRDVDVKTMINELDSVLEKYR